MNHQADVALAMDGTIASEPTAGCVYVSRYLGIIVAIATDGSTRYIARTIAPDPPPRVLSTPEGQRRVLQEDVRHVVRSASLDRGRLFTLTTTQDHNNSVLDVYSFADGNYAYSAKLADGTWQFVVADSYAYAVVDNVLTRWTLQSNSRP